MSAAQASWTKPRALRPGDLVGVCAPASPVDERLDRGLAELEALGFGVRVDPGIRERQRFTAGTRERRVAEIEGLFRDEAVAGVFCARGGAGAAWLLPRLDLDLLGAHPKVFCGYSDVTFLHAALAARRQVVFHGPMAAWDLFGGGYDRESFRAAVMGEGEPYRTAPGDLEVLRTGEAEGRLLGGCLSILVAALGTPWALRPADDTILFLEDVDERPYRIDRMLFQLRAAGTLDRVRGIVFGDMQRCFPPQGADFTLEEVIEGALSGLDIPVALGLSSGHTASPNVTLPLGVRARLACGDEARFEVMEAAAL